MIGIRRESNRREFQSVEHRLIEKTEAWILPPQLRQVVLSKVVAYQESGAGRYSVHTTGYIAGGQTPGRKCHHRIAVRADRANL